jgi:hypothetical protein
MNIESPASPDSPESGHPELEALTREQNTLQRQFSSMLWVIFALIATVTIGLGMEVWQLRNAAANAQQIAINLEQILGTVTEFRQIAGKYPDLATLGRRHGIEPISASQATPGSRLPAGVPGSVPGGSPRPTGQPQANPGAAPAPGIAPRR